MSVHTDPSRKRIFFENALQTGENWKLQYCVLVWTKHFWKTCDFRARVLTGDCCEFKFLQRTAVWTVTKAMVLQNGFVLRLYLWYLLCKNLPSTHSVTTPTKAIQDWLIFLRNRSNTKDRIWPHFQTPRRLQMWWNDLLYLTWYVPRSVLNAIKQKLLLTYHSTCNSYWSSCRNKGNVTIQWALKTWGKASHSKFQCMETKYHSVNKLQNMHIDNTLNIKRLLITIPNRS